LMYKHVPILAGVLLVCDDEVYVERQLEVCVCISIDTIRRQQYVELILKRRVGADGDGMIYTTKPTRIQFLQW
jgi:hypothetical protein